MKILQVLFWCLSLTLVVNCSGEMRMVNGQYSGFWGETTWVFDFKINGTYSLDVDGPAGDFLTQGKFVTARNMVLLHQDSTYLDVINLDRLLKVENGCLKDMAGNYYCKDEDKRQEAIKNAY